MSDEFDKKREEVESELESLIRDNIPPKDIVQVLKDGLKAMKVVYKVECEDYVVRLAYAEANIKYGRYFDAKGNKSAGLNDPRLHKALALLPAPPAKETLQ